MRKQKQNRLGLTKAHRISPLRAEQASKAAGGSTFDLVLMARYPGFKP